MNRRLTWSSCLPGVWVQHRNLRLPYEVSTDSLRVMVWCKWCCTDTLSYHSKALKTEWSGGDKDWSRSTHLHLFWSWSSPSLGHTQIHSEGFLDAQHCCSKFPIQSEQWTGTYKGRLEKQWTLCRTTLFFRRELYYFLQTNRLCCNPNAI